ncbi:MAG: methyltransferase domain-containing protein [Proteobacteria bacterium]|nr:methyltransferase domain-containing protein [Pseudomonadota bacterium]
MKNFVIRFHNRFPPASLILKFHGLQNHNKILDIGCGNNSVLKSFKKNYKYGIDAFQEYINQSRDKKIHNDYQLADINKINLSEIIRNFDAVIVFDVLEHLATEQAINLIETLESADNIKFIAFRTPSIYLDQDNYDNNDFQIHKSHIPSDFFSKKGYMVYGVDGPAFLNIEGNLPRREQSFFKSILSLILRPFFLSFPDSSMNYLAIKTRG